MIFQFLFSGGRYNRTVNIRMLVRGVSVTREIAEDMVQIGIFMDDERLLLQGWREAFYNEPDVDHLLMLIHSARTAGNIRLEADAALREIQSRAGPAETPGNEPEAARRVRVLCCMIAGRHWQMREFEGMKISVLYMMKLVGYRKKIESPVVNELWNQHLAELVGDDREWAEELRLTIEETFASVALTDRELSRYSQWCLRVLNEQILKHSAGLEYSKCCRMLLGFLEIM